MTELDDMKTLTDNFVKKADDFVQEQKAKPMVWELDKEIKNEGELAMFLQSATTIVKNIKKPTKKDMVWLGIACNDFLRIAKQRGWLE